MKRGLGYPAVVDDATEAVLDGHGMEVDQQAKGQAGGSEVGERLGEVNVVEGGDGFEFHERTALDQQVEALTGDADVLVRNEDLHLVVNVKAVPGEFVAQGGGVDALHQTRTPAAVSLDGATNDPRRNRLDGRRQRCASVGVGAMVFQVLVSVLFGLFAVAILP